MDYSTVAIYMVAVIAYNVSPGPLMAVLVSRSVGRDTKGAMSLALGFCIADVIAVFAVAYGVGIWAANRPDLLSIGKYLGVAYLLWLAIGMWKSSSTSTTTQPQKTGSLGSVGAGIALCLGNPATLLIYMLLLPTIAPQGLTGGIQIAFVAFITFLAAAIVFFSTVLVARQLSGVIASPSSTQLFGRITAATLALTSVWILTT